MTEEGPSMMVVTSRVIITWVKVKNRKPPTMYRVMDFF